MALGSFTGKGFQITNDTKLELVLFHFKVSSRNKTKTLIGKDLDLK